MVKTSINTLKQNVNAKPTSVLETEESEYYRASECELMLDKAVLTIKNLEKDLIEANRKSIALDQISKDFASQNKNFKNKLQMCEQEISHNKNRNIKSTLSENKLHNYFVNRDDYIKSESTKGIKELIEQLKKQYN